MNKYKKNTNTNNFFRFKFLTLTPQCIANTHTVLQACKMNRETEANFFENTEE